MNLILIRTKLNYKFVLNRYNLLQNQITNQNKIYYKLEMDNVNSILI